MNADDLAPYIAKPQYGLNLTDWLLSSENEFQQTAWFKDIQQVKA